MLAFRATLSKLSKFACIRDLKERIEKGYPVIQQKVDVALGKVCSSFDAKAYEKVLIAYKLLDDQNVTQKIRDKFISDIDESVYKAMLGLELARSSNKEEVMK